MSIQRYMFGGGPIAAAALLALGLAAQTAPAQRVFVVTESMSATGDTTGVHLHSIEFGLPQVLPGPIDLPGTACKGPVLCSDEGLLAVSSAQVTLCWPSPFEAAAAISDTASRDWRLWAACLAADPRTGDTLLVTLGMRAEPERAREGCMMVFRRARQTAMPGGVGLVNTWTLPGQPVGAVSYAGTRVAVLCRSGLGVGAIIVSGDLLDDPGAAIPVILEAGKDTSGLAASGLMMTGNGEWIIAAASGFQLGGGVAEPVSRLYAMPVRHIGAAPCFSDLRGTLGATAGALCAAAADTCWAITNAPGTEFAYATRLRVASDGTLTKEKEYALAPGPSAPLLTARPGSEDVAVALGQRLEIWLGGERSGASGEYAHRLGAVLWTEEGLFAGEANQVHQVSPETGQPIVTAALQTGRVAQLALVSRDALPADDTDADGLPDNAESRMGTSPENPDTDSDGIPDGVDPEPTIPSPKAAVAWRITFRGRAAGQEIRAVTMPRDHGETSRWRVEYDQDAMDWLVVTPQTGKTAEPCYLAVNPARYRRGVPVSGVLRFHLDGSRPGEIAHGSPAEVLIDVAPVADGPMRTLWLVDADNVQLDAFAGLLGAPPFHFSIIKPTAPYLETLDSYGLVVMDALSSARGTVPRQALLDYVAQGGGLLLIGQYLADTGSRSLSHLLGPLGFTIDPSVLVEPERADQVVLNSPEDSAEGYLARYWPNPQIEGGCALSAAGPYALAVDGTNPDHALAVARPYGYGRVLALAAVAPLQAPVVDGAGRRFVEAAVAWLSRAGVDIADMDGDGLPDDVEDLNDNGAWDTGETDYLRADTDGDGIPDGIEDQNRNGTLDDGETDPRNMDSDGDGIYDGADSSPCPTIGAPYVVAVEGIRGPAEGPSEGGTTVIVYGRNFTQDCGVWFGGRLAMARIQSSDTAVAFSPGSAREEGETVQIRVLPAGESPSSANGDTPSASSYRYTQKSRVRLFLEPREVSNAGPPGVSGEFLVLFDAPAEVRARQALLMLHVEPSGALEVQGVPETQQGGATIPHVLVSKTAPDTLQIYTPPELAPFSSCLLGRVAWRLNEGIEPDAVRVVCDGAVVAGVTGAPLDASCRAAVALVPGTVSTPTRAQVANPQEGGP